MSWSSHLQWESRQENPRSKNSFKILRKQYLRAKFSLVCNPFNVAPFSPNLLQSSIFAVTYSVWEFVATNLSNWITISYSELQIFDFGNQVSNKRLWSNRDSLWHFTTICNKNDDVLKTFCKEWLWIFGYVISMLDSTW